MKFTQKLLIAACLAVGIMMVAPQIASAMPIAPSAQSQADNGNGLVQQARRLCPYGMHRSPYGCVRDRYYGNRYYGKRYYGNRYYGNRYGYGYRGGRGYYNHPRRYYRY